MTCFLHGCCRYVILFPVREASCTGRAVLRMRKLIIAMLCAVNRLQCVFTACAPLQLLCGNSCTVHLTGLSTAALGVAADKSHSKRHICSGCFLFRVGMEQKRPGHFICIGESSVSFLLSVMAAVPMPGCGSFCFCQEGTGKEKRQKIRRFSGAFHASRNRIYSGFTCSSCSQ